MLASIPCSMRFGLLIYLELDRYSVQYACPRAQSDHARSLFVDTTLHKAADPTKTELTHQGGYVHALRGF